jgi:hypothetical protein
VLTAKQVDSAFVAILRAALAGERCPVNGSAELPNGATTLGPRIINAPDRDHVDGVVGLLQPAGCGHGVRHLLRAILDRPPANRAWRPYKVVGRGASCPAEIERT